MTKSNLREFARKIDMTKSNLREFARSRVDHLKTMTEKARQANTGNRRVFSDEHRRKLSEAAKLRAPVEGGRASGWRGDDLGFKYITLYRRIYIKRIPIESALTLPLRSKKQLHEETI